AANISNYKFALYHACQMVAVLNMARYPYNFTSLEIFVSSEVFCKKRAIFVGVDRRTICLRTAVKTTYVVFILFAIIAWCITKCNRQSRECAQRCFPIV